MSKKGSKKGVAMSLNDFLAADEFGSSWADDVADLPSAPAAAVQTFSSDSRGYAYDSGAAGGDGRPQGQLPTSPPWTCFIGNLAYDTSDRDLATLFGALRVKNIRLLSDHDGKPKGFGYVEFEDRDSLVEALKLSGESVMRRNIRIDVAEPPKRDGRPERGGDFDRPDRSAELDSAWRRPETGPPAPRPDRGFGGDRGFDRGGDRDRGFGGGFRRDEGQGGGRFGDDRRGGDRGFGGDRGDRGFGGGDRGLGGRSDAAPTERKKLVLLPRTTPVADAEAAKAPAAPAKEDEKTSTEPKKPKSNPFGAAKPRDENEIMKQVEERLQKREAEKKAEAEAAAKKAEEEAAIKKKEQEEQRKAEAERKEAERAAAKEAEEKAKKEQSEKAAAARPAAPARSGSAKSLATEESRADTASSWRRDAPVKPAAARGSFRGGRGGRAAGAPSREISRENSREGESSAPSNSNGNNKRDNRGPRQPKPLPTLEKEQVKLESQNVFDLLGDE
ncbi:hypothetical protein DFJ77DRAFT_459674 [Powellomyces hirtus]|nr:hypothetical protein DFJ77DRAFT_459674 [Powellomyces hirtus]